MKWQHVDIDGQPPCNGETVYVGINSAGYACCFNEMRHGVCVMVSAESYDPHMSELRYWSVLERPELEAA
jgi:hypothetical protein